MSNKVIDALPIAQKIIGNYLAVKAGEEVLIVIDPETDMTMPQALASVSLSCGAEYTIAMMPSRLSGHKSTTTTNVIAEAMKGADVYISMTRSSGASVYDNRLKQLLKAKQLRECSMVMRDLDNYIKGGALADYEALYEEGQDLKRFWEQRDSITITSSAGTNLRADLGPIRQTSRQQMPVIVECGIARQAGDSMAFSDGEVSQAPVEGSMNGILVIDGPMTQFGMPKSAITFEIVKGKITSVDSKDLQVLNNIQHILEAVPNADNIAEIGIGLNPKSLLNGDFQEEKKARGTCHIALGDNLFFEGMVQCDVHMDMIMYKPTIVMDDIIVVDNGQIVTSSFQTAIS